MSVIVESPLVSGDVSVEPGDAVQISVVAYGHSAGIPARFCTGLLPAVDLSRRFESHGIKSVVRIVDPTPIANHCNGWDAEHLQSQFRDAASQFLSAAGTGFFFDEAERMCDESLRLLRELGAELEASTDPELADVVRRIRESGRKHGGEDGANNATLYMAAHPFSWLDMYHPLVWKRSYPSEGREFVNLMSKAEERFSVVRRFLRGKRPDLCTKNNAVDRFTTVCNVPCYIPLEGEPLQGDLVQNGFDWCHERYRSIKGQSGNHRRVCKDFEALMEFLHVGVA